MVPSKVDDSPTGVRDPVDPGSGCRTCCSIPHGKFSVVAAVIGTIAFSFTAASLNSCHFLGSDFMYCHPPPEPKPTYGTCGDCHCITWGTNMSCPTDPDKIPITDVSDDHLRQLKDLTILNPMNMTCNPYNTTGKSCTSPPQDEIQKELWETAPCGIKYNMESLTEDQCPTEYSIKTYNSEAELYADDATMTHWGACGVCSTLQDLAVYIEYPDLTGKGQECGIRGLVDTNDGIDCFMEVGYTRPCAEMWMYNVFNTRDHCFDVCIDFTFFGDGSNNGPPPECKIADCLLCDEQMSGPIFQTEAARSRRRSGLLSKIARSCEVILIVPHEPPCNTTRKALQRRRLKEIEQFSPFSLPGSLRSKNASRFLQSSEKPVPPEKFRAPKPTETCVYQRWDLGLTGYAGFETQHLLPDFFLTTDEKRETTQYSTCYSYELRNAAKGYWANMQPILGSAYNAAFAFAVLAVTIGGICVVFTWVTMCVAYPRKFWTWTVFLFALCGLFEFLTLVFFKSGVCEFGCQIKEGAVFAIVAGILWWITAFIIQMFVQPYDLNQPVAKCCCCPSTVEGTGVYSHLPHDEDTKTEVTVTETTQVDGTILVEKVTKNPDGTKAVEVTTTRKKVESDAAAAPGDRDDETEPLSKVTPDE